MATNKVLLTKAASNSKTLQQVADDVVAKVGGSSLVKILVSQDTIIFDTDLSQYNQVEFKTKIDELDHGASVLDHENFQLYGTRTTSVPGSSSTSYWHLDAITRLDYSASVSAGNVGSYSATNEGDEVDIYILDSGVRGASRPTGVNVGLHPELFSPDNKANLNGTSEQGDYRVYELSSSLFTPNNTGNTNEPSSTGSVSRDGHGTNAAICAAGINAGVANKARIYSLRISDDGGSMSLSTIRSAYDAVYNHNDPDHAGFKGNTLDGNTRPRPSVVNCSFGNTWPNPKEPYVDRNERHVGQNYNFTVTASGSSNYTISGTDANGSVSGSDPTITVKKGDTLTFTMNAAGHPFHVQTGGASYNAGLAAAGVTGAGTASGGNVVFDTGTALVGKASGGFKYFCQAHASMNGDITVEESSSTASGSGDQQIDDGEYKLGMLKGVTVCRAAGNGLDFFDPDQNADVDYGPVNTKVVYGSRNSGQASKLDAEITYTDGYSRRGEEVGYGSADVSDIITVGALKVGTNNKLTFADFTNYGDAVTAYAPGQNLLIPRYDWASNTVTADNYSAGNHDTINGTSFSSPIVAGMAAIFRQVHDGATGTGEGKVCAKWAAERRYQFADFDDDTSIATTPVGGWLNANTISEKAATTRFLTDQSTETHYRMKTNAGTSNIVFQLTNAEYAYLSPQVNDVYEFEFPRVEDSPNAPDANSLMRAQMKKDTFNLGERRDYKVTVTNTGGGSPSNYSISVTNSGASAYVLNGTDGSGSISGNNLTINCVAGDTIDFNVSVGGHPFWIKTANTTGTGSGASGVTNNGAESGTVTWTPSSPGTYYYICQYHGGMVGTITVASSGGANKLTFDRMQNGVPNGSPSAGPSIVMENGVVYRFYQTDATNLTHPIAISNLSDGTHGGGKSFTDYVDQDLGKGAHGYKMNLRYYADQGSGVAEVPKTQYDNIAGSGVTCYLEWINPMGNTHPEVDSAVYPTDYHYYCVNHPGMGSTWIQDPANSGFGTNTECKIGGIDLQEFCSKWRKITAFSSVDKTITFAADSNATHTEEGGGGGFNKCTKDVEYDTGNKPRWPMRFTKITGTFYENDAFWNWINNYSAVVSNNARYQGGSHIAGEYWAQLEAEENVSDGKPVQYFPVPKSRFTHESIGAEFDSTHAYPNNTFYNAGSRWGRGMYDNQQHKFNPVPEEFGRDHIYDAIPAFQTYIDLVASWTEPSGSLATLTNGSNLSKDLSIATITTFANETVSSGATPVYELVSGGGRSPFTKTGSNYVIDGTGISVNETTGACSGTCTSPVNDTTYTLQIRDKVTNQTNDYSFTLVGTGSSSSTLTITGSPSNATGDGSYSVDSGTVSYTASATDSLGTTLEYQWKYAINSTQANLGNWTNVPITGTFAGAGGVNSATLTIPDNVLLNGYYFICTVNSATAASSADTGYASLTITVTTSCTVWWSGQTTLWPASECAGTSGSCVQAEVEIQTVSSDGATLTVVPEYSSTPTNSTGIVSTIVDSNNFCLEALGGNGSNGHPLYRVKLGEGTDGNTAFSDDTAQIQIKASHPTGLANDVIATGLGGPFTVQGPSYTFSTNLAATGSIQSGNSHTLSITGANAGSGGGVADATVTWWYKESGGSTWSIVDSTESWYGSRGTGTANAGTLVITPTTSLDQSQWKAVLYTDTASSGVTDTKNIIKFSGVASDVQTLTVQAAPTIDIVKPSGVTPDNSISITKGTLSTSEHLLTIASDGLPDPATHGADFVSPNEMQVIDRSHSIIYRGGTNTPSLTPWTGSPLGVFANGVSVRYPSAGNDTLPECQQTSPAGLEFNEVHFAALYNADSASGFTEGNGEYHYQTSAFLTSGDWDGVKDGSAYYRNSNSGGDYFRHADGHSKIVGIAYDGYPIYGPWGYTTYNDNTSAPKRLTSSFGLKATDAHRPTSFKFTDQVDFNDSTPSQTLVAGSFVEDYQYNPGSGDLDQSNGRYCVTPDYPNGTYAYFMPQDASNVPQYPYIVGTALRQAYYLPGTNAADPGGTNTQGPGNGGFDIRSIFTKGITMVAEGGGNNTREITGDAASMAFGSAPYTYQWQKSTDQGATFTNINSDPGFFNENSQTLSIYDNNTGVDNLLVRLKVTNSLSVYKISDAIPVQYIGSTLSISSQPADASIISGQAATFSVTAATTDDVTLTYQWEESQDTGTTWTDLPGETAASMVRSGLQTAASANGYQYRVKISSTSATNSPLTSDVADLTVAQGSITIATQPADVTKNEASNHQFSVLVTTNSGLDVIYQWQQWDGSAWQSVGTNASTLDLTAVDYATYNGAQYQVIATIPGLGALTSDTATLTVQRTISIDTNPVDVEIYATQNATFTVTANVSSGTATYQWEESQDTGTTWSDLAGATTASYTVNAATTAQSGYKYRVKVDVTGSSGSITSGIATLTVAVQPTLVITGQPADASVYQPDTHAFNVSASASDGSGLTWQWQKSDDNGTSWADIAGATTNGYVTPSTATATDNGDQYRVVISHPAATNSPLTSNAAVLTVITPVITIGNQPSSVQTTAGVPTSFSVSASVTSGKNITYQWQESGDNGTTWTDVTAATADNFSVTGSSANNNYRYRCVINSLGASEVNSQSATLTLTFIAEPTIQTSHIDSTTNKTFVRQPKIQASLFISYLGNGHAASFWKIVKNSDNSTVYDTTTDVSATGDETNKVELTTIVLEWNTSYTITVRYKDAAGYISTESPGIGFTTPVADQPTFTLPIPTSLRPTITLNTPSYDNVNYNHTSTDWQIADDASFSNVIYESLNDVDNKTELEVPSNVVLQSSTNYYVRTRLNVT